MNFTNKIYVSLGVIGILALYLSFFSNNPIIPAVTAQELQNEPTLLTEPPILQEDTIEIPQTPEYQTPEQEITEQNETTEEPQLEYPNGNGGSRGSKQTTPQNLTPTKQAIKILFLGDSITNGYGLEEKDIWAEIVKTHLDYNTARIGINGLHSDQLINNMDSYLEQYAPEYIVYEIGINDKEYGTQTVINNYITLAQKAQSINATPIFTTITPRDQHNEDILVENEWIRHNGFPYIEFYKDLTLQKTINGDMNTLLFQDLLHPNIAGNLIMANAVLRDMNYPQIITPQTTPYTHTINVGTCTITIKEGIITDSNCEVINNAN